MRLIHLTAAATLLAAASAIAQNDPAAGVFPFVKGRYWLYDGTVKFVENSQVREKKITAWRSEVVDTVEGKGFRAALLKGHPGDLAWFEEGKGRGDAIIVLTAGGGFHEIRDGEGIPAKFAALKPGGTLPDGFVDDGTILFQYPVKAGDRFGDPEQVKLGPRYCWAVTAIVTGKPDPAVKGVPADKACEQFDLAFRTTPDHTNLRFAVGIGITFYEYVHHGTKGDCEMRLVETGTGPTPPGKVPPAAP